jgi:tagaturonate epimerase
VNTYGLPHSLKLSVHSGSDKFSIYQSIHEAVKISGAGLHLKTAGTTWLEELTGLAESGGSGLAVAREIYAGAYSQRAELCAPYATVIDIDFVTLPRPDAVNGWSSERFTSTVRHDQRNKKYNPGFRQLLHVGFKVAAKMGDRYLKELHSHQTVISRNVTTNLFERHIRPVFLGL